MFSIFMDGIASRVWIRHVLIAPVDFIFVLSLVFIAGIIVRGQLIAIPASLRVRAFPVYISALLCYKYIGGEEYLSIWTPYLVMKRP